MGTRPEPQACDRPITSLCSVASERNSFHRNDEAKLQDLQYKFLDGNLPSEPLFVQDRSRILCPQK